MTDRSFPSGAAITTTDQKASSRNARHAPSLRSISSHSPTVCAAPYTANAVRWRMRSWRWTARQSGAAIAAHQRARSGDASRTLNQSSLAVLETHRSRITHGPIEVPKHTCNRVTVRLARSPHHEPTRRRYCSVASTLAFVSVQRSTFVQKVPLRSCLSVRSP